MASISETNFSALAAETIENILKFMPARSLANAALVCHLWKDVAQRVLKRRKRWNCRLFQCKDDHDIEEAKCVVQNQVFEFLENVDSVPSAMIVATTSGLLRDKKDIQSFLKKTQVKLPVNCPIVGCSGGGIIGEISKDCPEEVVGTHCKGMSVLIVPKVDGVNVHSFNFSKHEISKNKRNKQSWKNSFGSLVKQDIKFVFLMGQSDSQQGICKVVVAVKKVFGEHVVVIGGVAQPFTMSNGRVKSSGVVGLAIGGNVHANSTVHHGCTQQSLTGSFKLLVKDEPPERSAAFMVSCIGRGESYYGTKNVESSEFKKIFPGVELFGFFGDGEIGISMPAKAEPTKEGPFSNFLHSYSTVFSVLTFLDEKELP